MLQYYQKISILASGKRYLFGEKSYQRFIRKTFLSTKKGTIFFKRVAFETQNPYKSPAESIYIYIRGGRLSLLH